MAARGNSATAPHGDMGIGLCLACCNLHAAGKRDLMPAFAITMAPIPVPGGVVALPTCYEHLADTIDQAGKPPQLVRARRKI